MIYTYADFVPQFSCAMCGMCCRNDWQVTVDKESYYRNERLFSAQGRLEEFVRAFIPLQVQGNVGEYAFIAKGENGCRFLAADNRCSLQLAAGHEHLDSVCRTYPRYPMATERGWDITLSFSCPAVLKAAARVEPLEFVRSADKPLEFDEAAAVAHVFPHHEPYCSIKRYYFELERYCIAVLQWRALEIGARLDFLSESLAEVAVTAGQDGSGLDISRIIRRRYEVLESLGEPPITTRFDAGILVEHFMVNLVFKKIGYLYGFEKMMKLLGEAWGRLECALDEPADSGLALAERLIMEFELQYSHNRKLLLK